MFKYRSLTSAVLLRAFWFRSEHWISGHCRHARKKNKRDYTKAEAYSWKMTFFFEYFTLVAKLFCQTKFCTIMFSQLSALSNSSRFRYKWETILYLQYHLRFNFISISTKRLLFMAQHRGRPHFFFFFLVESILRGKGGRGCPLRKKNLFFS